MRALNSYMTDWKRLSLPPFCILGNSQLDSRFLCRLLTGYSQTNDSNNHDLPHLSEGFLRVLSQEARSWKVLPHFIIMLMYMEGFEPAVTES